MNPIPLPFLGKVAQPITIKILNLSSNPLKVHIILFFNERLIIKLKVSLTLFLSKVRNSGLV